MQRQKKQLTKSQLLQWIAPILKPSDLTIAKIQQLGTGIGYLLILNYIHPGILNGINFVKKPRNQYQYVINLKGLGFGLRQVGVNKVIDVDKLSKMKVADNMAMLQWLYNYYQSRNTRSKQLEFIRQQKMQKKSKNRAVQKLKLIQPNTNIKIDINQNQNITDLKIVNSATKKIGLIKQIIDNQNEGQNQIKIQKICSILNLKKYYKCHQVNTTPKNKDNNVQVITHSQEDNINKMEQINHVQQVINENCQKQKKQITYVKCRKLQQRYEQYIKNSMLKFQEEGTSDQLVTDKEKFRLEAPMTDILECQSHGGDRNSVRLTDNSILLQSDRRSFHSEYLLNDQ